MRVSENQVVASLAAVKNKVLVVLVTRSATTQLLGNLRKPVLILV